jgi:DCN1-like protein 4/5
LTSFAVVLNDLNDLIVLGRPAAAMSHVKSQRGAVYDTTRYDSYAVDTRKAFSSFYSFCFALAKPEYVRYFLPLDAGLMRSSRSSRNIDMETACALWSVVLVPQFPLITDVTEFINVGSEVWVLTTLCLRALQTTGSYKGVNKDLWSMVRDGLTTTTCGVFIIPRTDARILQGHAARSVKL